MKEKKRKMPVLPRITQGLKPFAALVLDGMHPDKAAESVGRPGEAIDLLQDNRFPDAMLSALAAKLTGDLLPKALATVSELLTERDPKVRLAAARSIFSMAVPSGGTLTQNSVNSGSAPLESMSADELAEMIERLEQAKADKALTIEPGAQQNSDNQDANPLFQFG
jgi:hypothetical protein